MHLDPFDLPSRCLPDSFRPHGDSSDPWCANWYLPVSGPFESLRPGRPLFFDYFGGIFTQLELFNIVCNFTIFGLKVYYAFDGTTSHFISMILPQASTADVAAQADALQGVIASSCV